ncbi:MAG: RNA-protein complex protein Nop10 [Candidatus Altiarchaeota archaeon]|nr:RNA-protein complex protein Nop10 [Candidatus Altiarchaeota archaeon]
MSMKKCTSCGTYTLKAECPACGKIAASPHPARYSPNDKYGEYRRRMKKENI